MTNADHIAQAESAILDAVREYQRVLTMYPMPQSTGITYTPSTALSDDHRFKIDSVNALAPFTHDAALVRAAGSELPALQVSLLSFSPHWEDRIRAAALRAARRNEVTMPNGFPCIYEPADSPRNERVLRPTPFVWVASPDEAMLQDLLPIYRELWGAYEAQWPHSPSRTFQVGRLDRVSPNGVYRPGTTPDQVISQTMLTHDGMYLTAPEHLRKMHPLHETWAAARS